MLHDAPGKLGEVDGEGFKTRCEEMSRSLRAELAWTPLHPYRLNS